MRQGTRLKVKFLALTAALSLFLFAGGCQPKQPSFPVFDTTGETTGDLNLPQETEPADFTDLESPLTLTLAVPLGKEAAESLRLLFLARQAGLEVSRSGHYIGSEVKREELVQFDQPLSLEVLTVSADEGVKAEQIKLWSAAAGLPDIMYCRSAAVYPHLDQILPLNDWLYNEQLISPENIFAGAVDSIRQGQAVLGIPYMASVPLITFNLDLLTQLEHEEPSADPTWAQWRFWLEGVYTALTGAGLSAEQMQVNPDNDETDLSKAVFVQEDLAAFASFLPSSLSSTGWATWDGYSFNFADNSFLVALSWLRELAAAGYSPAHLTAQQQAAAFPGQTRGRAEGRVVSWLIDSTELSFWHQQTAVRVGNSLIPSGQLSADADEQNQQLSMPLAVRCLVISNQTKDTDWACRLAAFIALDPDALLMQSRYQIHEGLYPLLDDPQVWQALVDRQTYGSFMKSYRERFNNPIIGGQQILPQWDKIMTEVLGKSTLAFLSADDDADLDVLFQGIQRRAAQVLREG